MLKSLTPRLKFNNKKCGKTVGRRNNLTVGSKLLVKSLNSLSFLPRSMSSCWQFRRTLRIACVAHAFVMTCNLTTHEDYIIIIILGSSTMLCGCIKVLSIFFPFKIQCMWSYFLKYEVWEVFLYSTMLRFTRCSGAICCWSDQ